MEEGKLLSPIFLFFAYSSVFINFFMGLIKKGWALLTTEPLSCFGTKQRLLSNRKLVPNVVSKIQNGAQRESQTRNGIKAFWMRKDVPTPTLYGYRGNTTR